METIAKTHAMEKVALRQSIVTVDALWDALRKRCCATKPWTDAKCIVQLRRDDLAAAFKDLHKPINN